MTQTEYNEMEIKYIIYILNICERVEKGISDGSIDDIKHIQSYSKDNAFRLSDCILKLKCIQKTLVDFEPAQ